MVRDLAVHCVNLRVGLDDARGERDVTLDHRRGRERELALDHTSHAGDDVTQVPELLVEGSYGMARHVALLSISRSGR